MRPVDQRPPPAGILLRHFMFGTQPDGARDIVAAALSSSQRDAVGPAP